MYFIFSLFSCLISTAFSVLIILVLFAPAILYIATSFLGFKGTFVCNINHTQQYIRQCEVYIIYYNEQYIRQTQREKVTVLPPRFHPSFPADYLYKRSFTKIDQIYCIIHIGSFHAQYNVSFYCKALWDALAHFKHWFPNKTTIPHELLEPQAETVLKWYLDGRLPNRPIDPDNGKPLLYVSSQIISELKKVEYDAYQPTDQVTISKK